MQLLFNLQGVWNEYNVIVNVPDKFFEYAESAIMPLIGTIDGLPLSDLLELEPPTFLQFGIALDKVNKKMKKAEYSLLFYSDAIYLRIEFEDGEVRDSSNWYGYDGERGDDGADNDEDAEDSDSDDDTTSIE